MIVEQTWHPTPSKRTHFTWEATDLGVRLSHPSGTTYTVPWATLKSVLNEVRRMAGAPGGVVTAGCSQTVPPTGSVGAWVKHSKLPILPKGRLDSRHLSFLGPVLGRMHHIAGTTVGKGIHWQVI